MPSAFKYVLDLNSTDGKEIEKSFLTELQARKSDFDNAWKYYEGEHKKQLELQSDKRDDNVVMNEVGVLTDKLASFLIGDGIEFKVFEEGAELLGHSEQQDMGSDIPALTDEEQNEVTVSTDADTEEGEELSDDEKAILDLMNANRDMIMLYNLALIGSVEGHCTVRIAPIDPEPGDGQPDSRMKEQLFPKIRPIKGEHFTAFWDPFDTEHVLWYRLQHIAGSKGKRIDYVRGQPLSDGETEVDWDHDAPVWTEVTYESDKIQSGMSPITQGDTIKWNRVNLVKWPYPWAPIVSWQNLPNPNGFYGRSDVKVAIKLNDHINFLMSNAMRIVKHFGSPRTIGIGFTGEDIKSEVGGLITVPKKRGDVDIFNLEMHGDINTALQLYDVLRFSLYQSGGMVDPRAVKDTVGHLTNFALRVMFLDSIKTTDKKHLLYEEGLKKVISRGMELMGRTDPEGRLDIIWSDVLPVDTTKVVEILLQELEAAIISKQTYRSKRGWDHHKEERRLQEEKDSSQPEIGEQILGMLRQNQGMNQAPPADTNQTVELQEGEEGTV